MSESDLDKSPVSIKRAREASFGEEVAAKVDPKDQVKIVSDLQEQHLKDGEIWYLVSKAWYTRWKQYCARLSSPQPEARIIGEQTNPGPINNSTILKDGKLTEDLVYNESESNNVYAVPIPAWNLLVEW